MLNVISLEEVVEEVPENVRLARVVLGRKLNLKRLVSVGGAGGASGGGGGGLLIGTGH